MADAKATAYLELDIKGFTQAIEQAKAALVAFAGFVAAKNITEFFKQNSIEAMNFASSIYRVSQSMGDIDPGKFFLLQEALHRSGLSAEEAQAKIQEFAETNKPIALLFKGGDQGLGRAFSEASQEFGTQAKILSESAGRLAEMQVKFEDLGTKLRGFFLGAVSEVAPVVENMLKQIDKVDLVGMGQKFGSSLKQAVEVIYAAFATGNVFKTAGLALKIGLSEAYKFFISEMSAGLNALGPEFKKSLDGAGINLQIVADSLNAAAKLLMDAANALKYVESVPQKIAIGAQATAGTLLDGIGSGLEKIGLAEAGSVMKIVGYAYTEQANTDADTGGNTSNNSDVVNTQKLTTATNATVTPKLIGNDSDKKEFSALLASLQDVMKSLEANTDADKNPTQVLKSGGVGGMIADSLARVGGGGRYVRTGLSVTDQAQLRTAAATEQIATAVKDAKSYDKKTPLTLK